MQRYAGVVTSAQTQTQTSGPAGQHTTNLPSKSAIIYIQKAPTETHGGSNCICERKRIYANLRLQSLKSSQSIISSSFRFRCKARNLCGINARKIRDGSLSLGGSPLGVCQSQTYIVVCSLSDILELRITITRMEHLH